MTTIHELAPYPQKYDDVTAEALVKHYAAFTLMHHNRAQEIDFHAKRAAYDLSVNITCLGFLLTATLKAAFEQAGDGADDLARGLWEDDCDPGTKGPMLWRWCRELGVDPEVVREIGEESARNA